MPNYRSAVIDDDIERSTVGAMMARGGVVCLRGAGGLGAVLCRRPIDSLGFLLAASATGMVLVNALFLQAAPHPAPIMAVKPRPVASDITSSLPPRPALPAPAVRQADSVAPRTEIVKTEIAKSEPAKMEAPKAEIAKAEVAKTEVAKTDTGSARTRTQIVADIQRELSRRGFFDGPVDGVHGSKTDLAIRDFEQAAGIKGDHQPDDALLRLITRSSAHATAAPVHAAAPPPARATTPPAAPTRPATPVRTPPPAPVRATPAPAAAPVQLAPPSPAPVQTTGSVDVPRPPAPIRMANADAPSKRIVSVQRALADFGYGQVAPTGVMGAETKAAIERFERERKLPVTGQVSDRLVRELAAVTGRPLE